MTNLKNDSLISEEITNKTIPLQIIREESIFVSDAKDIRQCPSIQTLNPILNATFRWVGYSRNLDHAQQQIVISRRKQNCDISFAGNRVKYVFSKKTKRWAYPIFVNLFPVIVLIKKYRRLNHLANWLKMIYFEVLTEFCTGTFNCVWFKLCLVAIQLVGWNCIKQFGC